MRMQYLREEREEERSFSWLSLLIPAALVAAIFWLLPRLKEEEDGQGQTERRPGQSKQKNISMEQSRAAQESRAEHERQSGLQRQQMRQDQTQQERPQKEMKQPQAKERGQEKSGQRASGGDKLEEIEGIGPKTADVLRGQGITTFRQLADTPIERLNEIMEEAGFRINPPDTWPEQARYAADGDWDGLKSLKERLQAGRPQKNRG